MKPATREAKFLSKCRIDEETGCWVWQGMREKRDLYGRVKRDGKTMFAHRYAWTLFRGPIGPYFVLHKCDNPPCCNPDHLFLGTQSENQKDMKAKSRHVHGERSPNAKLTEKDVLAMYDLYEQGIGTIRLAEMFGVTKNLTWLIVRGRSWNHLYTKRYGN